MKFSIVIIEGIALIKVTCDLISTYDLVLLDDEVKNQITGGHKYIILELSGVENIDSSGSGKIMSSINRVTDSDGRVIFVNMSEQVKEIFKTTGMDKKCIICDTVDQAILRFK